MIIVVSLYIVDENEAVRSALAERLDEDARVDVVGHASNPDFVLRHISQLCPEVVLIEVKRSDGLGLEIIRRLADLESSPYLVVLTSYPSAWEEAASRRAGAHSYLLKDIDPGELICQISSTL